MSNNRNLGQLPKDDRENFEYFMEAARRWGKFAIQKINHGNSEDAYRYGSMAAEFARKAIMYKALL